MIDISDPAWWKSAAAVVAAFLALFNVPGDLSTSAQGVIAAAGFFVAAVYVHERHATNRATDAAAAQVQTGPIQVALNELGKLLHTHTNATAGAAHPPAPATAAGVVPPAGPPPASAQPPAAASPTAGPVAAGAAPPLG